MIDLLISSFIYLSICLFLYIFGVGVCVLGGLKL